MAVRVCWEAVVELAGSTGELKAVCPRLLYRSDTAEIHVLAQYSITPRGVGGPDEPPIDSLAGRSSCSAGCPAFHYG